MSAEIAFAPNTKEIRCDVTAAMLRSRYGELAYYRVMLGRARAAGDKRRVEAYEESVARARRCIESLLHPRRAGVVVFPEIREEVRRWAQIARRREMPW